MKGRDNDEAEEKRLMYVGMTRAAQELILISRPAPSSFLQLIPKEKLQKEKPSYRRKIKIDQLTLFGK